MFDQTPHARSVLAQGDWDERQTLLRVTLDHDRRHRRRIALSADDGTRFVLDLREARHLRDGDGLVLDDGRVVRVVSAAEPLDEITAPDAETLLRVGWHLGNRHLPVAIQPGGAIRIRADHVIRTMVRQLGGSVRTIEAAFDPESGAYSGTAGGHDHGRAADDNGYAHSHGQNSAAEGHDDGGAAAGRDP